jgi:hypothetical protein
MSYQTKIVGDVVEVTSSRTSTMYAYKVPPGTNPAAYSLRCAERARVSDCLAAIQVAGRRGPRIRPGFLALRAQGRAVSTQDRDARG